MKRRTRNFPRADQQTNRKQSANLMTALKSMVLTWVEGMILQCHSSIYSEQELDARYGRKEWRPTRGQRGPDRWWCDLTILSECSKHYAVVDADWKIAFTYHKEERSVVESQKKLNISRVSSLVLFNTNFAALLCHMIFNTLTFLTLFWQNLFLKP